MLFDLGPERAAKRTSPQSGPANLDATLLVRPEVISNNWAQEREALNACASAGHYVLLHVCSSQFCWRDAALATLDVYQAEGISEKVARIASKWESAIHDIRSAGGIVRDIRNLGLLGAVKIEAAPDAPGQRARAVANHCLQNGVFVRALGDTLILSPPLIIEEGQISQIAESIKKGVRSL